MTNEEFAKALRERAKRWERYADSLRDCPNQSGAEDCRTKARECRAIADSLDTYGNIL